MRGRSGIERETRREGEPGPPIGPSLGHRVGPPPAGDRTGAAAARAGAIVLLALAIPAAGFGVVLVLSLRHAWIGLPLAGWGALVTWRSLATCRRPGQASDRWTMAVGLVSALGVVQYVRMIRPLDPTLGLTIALLTGLLASSGLIAWSRLAPTVAAGPHPWATLAASAVAGVALVVIAALAPLADQPPFAPLRLSAVAEVDAECGRFHVDDPRGMGSLGFDSVERAPEGWHRHRGTLVLLAEREGWFEAAGQRLALKPSNGLSACSDTWLGTRRHRQVAPLRVSRPSPPSAAR